MRGSWLVVSAALVACGLHAFGAQPEELVACPVSDNLRGHENIEWSISYAFHLTDGQRKLPRAFLIGDSICNGYKDAVARNLSGKMSVTYWCSSYCLTSPGYLRLLAFYLDEAKYSVIHFNNGLHSLSTPDADWEKGLRAALKLIRLKQPQAKIVWTASTPLKDPAKTAKAKRLNAIADKVIAEFGNIVKDDLFAAMDPLDRNRDWSDCYHFRRPAIERQARQVAASCLQAAGIAK